MIFEVRCKKDRQKELETTYIDIKYTGSMAEVAREAIQILYVDEESIRNNYIVSEEDCRNKISGTIGIYEHLKRKIETGIAFRVSINMNGMKDEFILKKCLDNRIRLSDYKLKHGSSLLDYNINKDAEYNLKVLELEGIEYNGYIKRLADKVIREYDLESLCALQTENAMSLNLSDYLYAVLLKAINNKRIKAKHIKRGFAGERVLVGYEIGGYVFYLFQDNLGDLVPIKIFGNDRFDDYNVKLNQYYTYGGDDY